MKLSITPILALLLEAALAIPTTANTIPSSSTEEPAASFTPRNMTTPSLVPFITISVYTATQQLSSDARGYVGVFQQTGPAGNFTGKDISGTIPVAGNFELVYPQSKLSRKAYLTGTFVLKTTKGETLTIRPEGPAIIGDKTDRTVQFTGYSTMQTQAKDLAYLNEKAFVIDFAGDQLAKKGYGEGTLYEIVSGIAM